MQQDARGARGPPGRVTPTGSPIRPLARQSTHGAQGAVRRPRRPLVGVGTRRAASRAPRSRPQLGSLPTRIRPAPPASHVPSRLSGRTGLLRGNSWLRPSRDAPERVPAASYIAALSPTCCSRRSQRPMAAPPPHLLVAIGRYLRPGAGLLSGCLICL